MFFQLFVVCMHRNLDRHDDFIMTRGTAEIKITCRDIRCTRDICPQMGAFYLAIGKRNLFDRIY